MDAREPVSISTYVKDPSELVSCGDGLWRPLHFSATYDDPERPFTAVVDFTVSLEGEPYVEAVHVTPRVEGRGRVRPVPLEDRPLAAPPRPPAGEQRLRQIVHVGEAPPDRRVAIADVHRLSADDQRIPLEVVRRAALRDAVFSGERAPAGTLAGPGRYYALDPNGEVARNAARPRRPRRKLTEGLLCDVLRVVRDAEANGKPIRRAVQEHFDLDSEYTARNWIKAARDFDKRDDEESTE